MRTVILAIESQPSIIFANFFRTRQPEPTCAWKSRNQLPPTVRDEIKMLSRRSARKFVKYFTNLAEVISLIRFINLGHLCIVNIITAVGADNWGPLPCFSHTI